MMILILRKRRRDGFGFGFGFGIGFGRKTGNLDFSSCMVTISVVMGCLIATAAVTADESTTTTAPDETRKSTTQASYFPNQDIFATDPPPVCSVPPDFPREMELYPAEFRNWAEDLVVPSVWNVIPRNTDDIIKLVNYAYENNFKIRPSGFMHTWAPTTVVPIQPMDGPLLQNFTKHPNPNKCYEPNMLLVKLNETLTNMQMLDSKTSPYPFPAVKVQAGASLEKLMNFLEQQGYGLNASPAPGTITLGGIMAIAGHGTGVPAYGERLDLNLTYGSLSNLILELTAVVWDPASETYNLKKFSRADSETKAFLTNLGRTLLVDMTLRVIPNYYLRCESRVDIPAKELFADPQFVTQNTRTIASIIETSGRIETILFPFTSRPWLKTWSLSPHRPLLARLVTAPYNYPFSDNIPVGVALLAANITSGNYELTPSLGEAEYNMVVGGLASHFATDLWGLSKNTLLYIKPTTLRLTENGAAILTSRKYIQKVISESFNFFQGLQGAYAAERKYPVNGPLEIRVSGMDNPEDVGIEGAEAPAISPVSPYKNYDVTIWFNILTFPGTPHVFEFLEKMERFFYEKYNGSYALIRPEWSKGWAYTRDRSWNSQSMLRKTIPDLFPQWDFATSVYNKYDPHQVFTNSFLQILFPPPESTSGSGSGSGSGLGHTDSK